MEDAKPELEAWDRKHFEPGGGDAFLFYVVYGSVDTGAPLSRSKYRSDGLPHGLEVMAYGPNSNPEVSASFREGLLWEQLRAANPELADTIAAQDSCVVLRGTFPDPENLNYLRDTVGLITHFLEKDGCKAAFPEITVEDAQIGGIFCNHELLFGICFVVPESDPLGVLIESYHATHMPGRKAEGHSTPLDEVNRLRARLQELGLKIDPVCYAHFAEAFIPISFSSATSYSLERSFAVTHASKNGRVSLEPRELGFESADGVKNFVETAWTRTEELVYPEKWQTCPPDNLLGAGVGANSD